MPARTDGQLALPGPLGTLYRRLPAPVALPHRFHPKVDRSAGPDACWGWLGALSAKRSGHTRGVIWHRGRLLQAHRVALWLATDPYGVDLAGYDRPDLPGYHACHRCPQGHWALCCNPRHLAWGTPEENRRDRYARDAAAIVAATFGE